MNQHQEQAIPINEWVESIYLASEALCRPGEFDITSALRARYGNMLKESIISVRLYAEDRNVELIVMEAGNPDQIVVDFSQTIIEKEPYRYQLDELSYLSGAFFYGIREPAPERDAPMKIRMKWLNQALHGLYELFDDYEVAKQLHIFTPHCLALLQRIGDSLAYTREQEKAVKSCERGIRFYKSCIKTMTQQYQDAIQNGLIQRLAKKMKKLPAFGILGSDLNTYWDEIGVIAEEGSANLLYETLLNQIEIEISAAIEKLPEAEQFALWTGTDTAEGYFDDFESCDSYPEDVGSFKKDFTDTIEFIRNSLLSMAMDSLSPEARSYLGY